MEEINGKFWSAKHPAFEGLTSFSEVNLKDNDKDHNLVEALDVERVSSVLVEIADATDECRLPIKVRARRATWQKFSGDAPVDGALNVRGAEWMRCCDRIPKVVVANLIDKSFLRPTAIQAAVLGPAIAKRLDVVAAAETGSGKTLAFGIPIVSSLIEILSADCQAAGTVHALCIFPSRELARQAAEHIDSIIVRTPIQLACIVGGLSPQKQTRILDMNRPEIVCGTPGRLCAVLGSLTGISSNAVDATSVHMGTLGALRHLVLDEADRLIETNHFLELNVILDRIYSTVRDVRRLQTFIVSATLPLLPSKHIDERRKKRGRGVDMCFVEKESGTHRALCTSSSMQKKLDVLMKRVRLRESQLLCVNLASNKFAAHSSVTDEGMVVVEGKGSDSATPCENQHLEPFKNETLGGPLPSTLQLSMLQVTETDREWRLYALLSEFFRQKMGRKVMVFVNSVSYVLRLEPILRCLFSGTAGELSQRGCRAIEKLRNLSVETDLCGAVLTRKEIGPPRRSTIQPLSTAFESSPGASLLSSVLRPQVEAPSTATARKRTDRKRSRENAVSRTDRIELALPKTATRSKWGKIATTISSRQTARSVSVLGVHAKLKQVQRIRRMERLSQDPEKPAVLVCTDVAARGLDLPTVDLVVHFQPPRTASLFVHRSGRTARIGRAGRCVSVVTSKTAKEWRSIFRTLGLRTKSDSRGSAGMVASTSDILDELDFDHDGPRSQHLRACYNLAVSIDKLSHGADKKARGALWESKVARAADLFVSDESDHGATHDDIEDESVHRNLLSKARMLAVALHADE